MPFLRQALACLFLAGLPAATVPAENRVVAIHLVEGRAGGPELDLSRRGSPVIRLKQGEPVELRFSSDRPMALHLHGYRIETAVAPDRPAVIRFMARAAGRFALDTHGADDRHATLLYIEVHPQ